MNSISHENGNVHRIIGKWDGERVRLYSQAYGVTHLAPGYVVEFNDHYYRVYSENGNRGLRLWNVDVEVSRERVREVEVIAIQEVA